MSNEQNNSSGSPGGNAPAASVNPAPPPPELNRSAPANQAPQDNPRARGHSPAMQSREQQQAPAEANRFANEHKEADLLAALGERSERQSARATLPASPDQYRIELPADFQAPEGVRFEFDAKDPLLKTARELAHKRGISQEVFSCYPCMRVREWARRSVTRNSAT